MEFSCLFPFFWIFYIFLPILFDFLKLFTNRGVAGIGVQDAEEGLTSSHYQRNEADARRIVVVAGAMGTTRGGQRHGRFSVMALFSTMNYCRGGYLLAPSPEHVHIKFLSGTTGSRRSLCGIFQPAVPANSLFPSDVRRRSAARRAPPPTRVRR